jgi:hypothetical protein
VPPYDRFPTTTATGISPRVKRGVEEHPERAERLAAPFRPESKQHDMTRIELHVQCGRLAMKEGLADQVSREQW